jgi:hypothetical protein
MTVNALPSVKPTCAAGRRKIEPRMPFSDPPDPGDEIESLYGAWLLYHDDVLAADRILCAKPPPDLAMAVAIVRNHLRWQEFWAARHWIPEFRARFAEESAALKRDVRREIGLPSTDH